MTETNYFTEIFNNFIDEIDNEDGPLDYNLSIDTYLVFINSSSNNSGFITENHIPLTFESHDEAKKAASALARSHPGNIISILRVIENVGFIPHM